MLHLLNHALAKSTMFFLAGRVLHRYRTTEIGGVSGLLKAMPWTGGLFAAGILAALLLTPFGLGLAVLAASDGGVAAGAAGVLGLFLALPTVSLLPATARLPALP